MVATIGFLALSAPVAHAASLVVTGTGDTIAVNGSVTLREAITAANTDAASGDAPAGSGADVITFNFAGGGTVHAISPASALPTITAPLTISGETAGSTEIDASNAGFAAGLAVSGAGPVTIERITVRNATNEGILNLGNLTVRSSVMTDNGVSGISNLGSGSLTVRDSVMSGNDFAGVVSFRPLTLVNVTVTGNSGGSGVDNRDQATLVNVTVTGNKGGAARGGFANGDADASATIRNSIIWGNTPADCAGNPPANLGGNIGGCPGFTNVDPLLAPLTNAFGRLFTFELLPGSPAIDAGTDADCPPTDARGVLRPGRNGCDAGAYEVPGPGAITGAASDVTQTTATITGTNRNLAPTGAATRYFEWGESAAYGRLTSLPDVAPDTSSAAASAALTGLAPGTTYHYRLVAIGPMGGLVTGADRTFTTASAPATPVPPSTPPTILQLKLGSRCVPVAHRGRRTPVRVIARLSRAATLHVRVDRAIGAKASRRCAKRVRFRGKFRRGRSIAIDSAVWPADVSKRATIRLKLRPGVYRLRFTAGDATGRSRAVTRSLQALKR